MVRMMTIAAVAGWLVLGLGADASAQFATPGSCSEARTECMRGCGQRGVQTDTCLSACSRHPRGCMRSGEWRGRIRWSGLRRV
jgi:hypothetical protein